MDIERINRATPDIIKKWFQKLVLPTIKDILPENRYNMDESGIMEGLGVNGLVVGSAESKKALQKHPDSRIWTTILECISAIGKVTKPLVIFKGEDV